MTGQRRPDEMIRILRAEFITKPGGVPGGTCVTFTCGATGWRGAGGTIVRTLVHETAFQLDTGGNARGTYAIDLQQDRTNANEVAASPYSFICGSDNEINPVNGDWCTIFGAWNTLHNGYLDYVFGWFHDINESSGCMFVGDQTTVTDETTFVFSGGSGHDIDYLVTAHIWGESITVAPGASFAVDVYAYGFNHDIDDRCYGIYIWGESQNHAHAIYSAAFGLWHDTNDAYLVMVATGDGCKHDALGTSYLRGRILWNNNARHVIGDAQSSGFSQSEDIDTWQVAWTSSVLQFPIPTDTVWYFDARLAGTEGGAANSYVWKIEGVIENDGGVTTLLGVPTVTNVYRDVATKEWQVIADNVNDRLVFQYRDTAGPDGTNCMITLTMFTTEVTY